MRKSLSRAGARVMRAPAKDSAKMLHILQSLQASVFPFLLGNFLPCREKEKHAREGGRARGDRVRASNYAPALFRATAFP